MISEQTMGKFKGYLVGFVLFLLIGPVLIFALWTWASLSYSYATGERSGYVQKFSKKGWLCKTWEGELAMITLPGTAPQMFNFTVRDSAVAEALQKTVGQRVSISYDQHRFIPNQCFGETEYYVTAVHPLQDLYPVTPERLTVTPAPPPPPGNV